MVMKQRLLCSFAILLLFACAIYAQSNSIIIPEKPKVNRVMIHLKELQQEIAELDGVKQKLLDVVAVLKIDSTLNNKIISNRMKQVSELDDALVTLMQESKFIKDNVVITFPDGTRARSCKEYRYPSSPNKYDNEGSGLYQIEPTKGLIMNVYCDMTTDGGGWTLISGIRSGYQGIHFHTFEDSSAVETSLSTPFHIKTKDLLESATQIRSASDSSSSEIKTFYQSEWPFSAACQITSELRNAIVQSTINNGDLPSKCVILSGLKVTPTHFTYGRTCNDHSTGFRLGTPISGCVGHMDKSSYATYSFDGAKEGRNGINNGINWSFNGEHDRNGAVFLR